MEIVSVGAIKKYARRVGDSDPRSPLLGSRKKVSREEGETWNMEKRSETAGTRLAHGKGRENSAAHFWWSDAGLNIRHESGLDYQPFLRP